MVGERDGCDVHKQRVVRPWNWGIRTHISRSRTF